MNTDSNMFQHRGAIIRELLQQRCTSQLAYTYFAHSYNHNWNVWLLKCKIIYCWNLGAETCSSLCVSCVLYHEVRMLYNMLITRTCTALITQNFVIVVVRYSIHNNPPVVRNLIYNLPPSFFDINFSIIFPTTPIFTTTTFFQVNLLWYRYW